jgi:curved DNA-binding protein CbpA
LVPYVVLGLPRHATLAEIRARYRELVRTIQATTL